MEKDGTTIIPIQNGVHNGGDFDLKDVKPKGQLLFYVNGNVLRKLLQR